MGNQQHQKRPQNSAGASAGAGEKKRDFDSMNANMNLNTPGTNTNNMITDNDERRCRQHRHGDQNNDNDNSNSNSNDNKNDSNGDSNNDTMASLQQDLEHVEQTLEQHQQTHPNSIFHWDSNSNRGDGSNSNSNSNSSNDRLTNSGRAVFDSLGSALGSIRQRFQQLQQRQSISSNLHPSPSALAAAAHIPTFDFSERLETAERAHSTRMPLGMMRNHISSSQSVSTTTSAGPDAPETTTKKGTTTTPSSLKEAVDRKTSAASSGDGEDSLSDGGSSSSSPTRRGGNRRNASTLVASRRYAEAHETNEIAVHEGAALPPTGILKMEEEKEEEREKVGDDEIMAPTRHKNIEPAMIEPQEDGEARPMEVESSAKVEEKDNSYGDDDRPPTGIVLSIASIQKLDDTKHHGRILLPPITSHDSSSDEMDSFPILYSWGTGDDFNLFGTTESNPTDTPAKIPSDSRVGRSEIVSVSFGDKHAALATATGGLLICGNNSEGAVDPTQRTVEKLPWPMHLEPIMAMTTARVLHVACGLDHTAVLTETRSVLTFGNNVDGQLGHRLRPSSTSSPGDALFQSPEAMVLPRRAAQVFCGHRFTLVLTTRMEVYVCGREELTGYNTLDGPPRLPEQNPVLQGLPLVYAAAGDDHAVVLTAQGTAYAWGANPTGACGREYPKRLTVPVPVQVPFSSMEQPRQANGRLPPAPFSNWAAWEDGSPNIITLAEDVAVVDAACGKNTTILVTKTGRLLVAGSNDQLQLGLDKSAKEVSPVQTVDHPTPGITFVSAEAGTNFTLLLDSKGDVWCMGHGAPMKRVLEGQSIATIAAGGTHSLAIASKSNTTAEGPSKASTSTPGLEGLLDGILLEQEVSKQESAAAELSNQTEELFRCPAVMNSVFLDPKEIDDLYDKLILAAGEQKHRQLVVSAMEKGMMKGLESIKSARLMYPESVRCLLLYLQCPLFRTNTSGKAQDIQFDVRGETIMLLCETILGLPFEGYKAFTAWSTSVYAKDLFVPFLVTPLIDQLNFMIKSERTRAVPVVVGVLRWFQNVAERFQDDVIATPADFYSKSVEELPIETLFEDLVRYRRASKTERSTNFFLSASPFLMPPSSKRNLLQVEHQLTMVQAAQAGGVQFDLSRRQFLFQPYFVMAIDRQYMLQQTLQAVASAAPGELRKSLKIVFKGEDGVDAGGVTKEFFQLLVVQLFDINTGMWTTQFGDGTNSWFNADCTWNQDGYYLVGILVGLAVYNSVILDVHFPQTVYRKLLGLPLGLEDMVDPEVMRGLKALLDYAGNDVEDIFCLTFEVAWNSLGMERKKELKPGGASIPVTRDNREEYVMRYVKWMLVDSIQNQYDEFERGFMQVMEGSSLELLRPEELELLVVGTPELDFAALEANTEYEGGFDKDSPVIRNLWRFVKQSPREAQLMFLKFATGSTKAPIGGLAELPFKIQRYGVYGLFFSSHISGF